MKASRLSIGDVFTIPIDEHCAGVGQVVAVYQGHAFYFAVFDLTVEPPARPDLAALDSAPVILLALSFDAKVHCGDWSPIGNLPVPTDMPLPAYREVVGIPPHVDVVDYSGLRRRRATQLEAECVPNRTVVAPVRLERALRAWHGLEAWQEAFSELEPSPHTTARLFASAQ